MRFFTLASVLACAAMALAAAVIPDALVSRGNSDLSSTVSALDQKCDTILPKLDGCMDAGCTNTIILELVAVIDASTSSCSGLKGITSWTLANQIYALVVKILTKLQSHKSSCNGKCGDLSVYAKVDLSLSLWLNQLGICLAGILAMVSTLLLNVVLLLEGLCLNSILKVCLLI